jgi:hypothetical protein
MERRRDHIWAVDGVEEATARVVEDGGRAITIPLYLLPPGVKEGDVLSVTRSDESGESVLITIAVDAGAAEKAQERSRSAQARTLAASRRDDPGGDVSL